MENRTVNRIGEAEQERLGLFTEEMGESQLEIGKILRHGIDSYHPDLPGLSNAERLELETGHVLAAIDLLVACGTLSRDGLERAKRQKFQKLRSWLHCGTNLDAVEELLGIQKPETEEDIDRDRWRLFIDGDAAQILTRSGAALDEEMSKFIDGLKERFFDHSSDMTIEDAGDALEKFIAQRRNSEDARAHRCDGTNIAQAPDGTFYCAHCGWNDPTPEGNQ